MPVCKKCGETFRCRVVIDGKRRNVGGRKYCLGCSPFGDHNTRKLHLPPTDDVQPGRPCVCEKCGREYHYRKESGHSTKTCNSCLVNLRRYKKKADAIEYKGGKCIRCGYEGVRCPAAMDFHHRDPSQKDFGLGGNHCLSWERIRRELDKCDLYCFRCHAELHWELGIEKRDRYEANGVQMEAGNPGVDRRKTPPMIKRCEQCGETFRSVKSVQKLCSERCHSLAARKVNRPSKEILAGLIEEHNWCSIGRMYGVSDNAVRKWARSYGLL